MFVPYHIGSTRKAVPTFFRTKCSGTRTPRNHHHDLDYDDLDDNLHVGALNNDNWRTGCYHGAGSRSHDSNHCADRTSDNSGTGGSFTRNYCSTA